jgi:hypothetical protein
MILTTRGKRNGNEGGGREREAAAKGKGNYRRDATEYVTWSQNIVFALNGRLRKSVERKESAGKSWATFWGHSAHSAAALPDGGFLRQICKILADLKVVWQAKTISCKLPISGGFLTDLTNFAWVSFCLADLADSGGYGVSISKKHFVYHSFLA